MFRFHIFLQCERGLVLFSDRRLSSVPLGARRITWTRVWRTRESNVGASSKLHNVHSEHAGTRACHRRHSLKRTRQRSAQVSVLFAIQSCRYGRRALNDPALTRVSITLSQLTVRIVRQELATHFDLEEDVLNGETYKSFIKATVHATVVRYRSWSSSRVRG